MIIAPQTGSIDISRGGEDREPDGQSGKALTLQIKETGGQTSAVVVADVPFEYDAFALSGPDRLVLDLKGIAKGELPSKTDVNSKTVKQIRVGHYQREPDITRLVFDLSGGAQYVTTHSRDKKSINVETYIPTISGSYAGTIADAGHGNQTGDRPKRASERILPSILPSGQKLLEAKGARVIMTRTEIPKSDWKKELTGYKAGADLFVSIHVNAHTDPSIGGTMTYICNGNGTAAEASGTRKATGWPVMFRLNWLKTGPKDGGVRSANFVVLRKAKMPAVLTELAFISNARGKAHADR